MNISTVTMSKFLTSTHIPDFVLVTAAGKVPCHYAVMTNISSVIAASCGNINEFGVSGFSLQAAQTLVYLIYEEKKISKRNPSLAARFIEVRKLMEFLEITRVGMRELYKLPKFQDIITVLKSSDSKDMHRDLVKYAFMDDDDDDDNFKKIVLVCACANPKVIFRHMNSDILHYIKTKYDYTRDALGVYAQICVIMIIRKVDHADNAMMVLSTIIGSGAVELKGYMPCVSKYLKSYGEPRPCGVRSFIEDSGLVCVDLNSELAELCTWINKELEKHEKNKKK